MKKIISVLLLVGVFFYGRSAFAESLTVTATVDTVYVLKGYTAPLSLVTFTENGAVLGTTTSNQSGYFEKEFNNQSAGVHTVSLYSTNPDNVNTITVSYDFLLLQNQSLTISGIYLPPSISISSGNYFSNQTVFISGYSVPSSLIKIEVVGSATKTDYVTTGSDGYYSDSISAGNLSLGNNQTTASLDILSVTSTTSESLSFTITTASTPTPTATPTTVSSAPINTPFPTSPIYPTMTPVPTQEPCPYPYPNLCFFDKKKAGFFEADDLSFLNYIIAFVKNFGKSLTLSADLNNDNIVDATDLSIIFYYVRSKSDKILGISVSKKDVPAVLGIHVQPVEFPSAMGNNNFMPILNNPSVKLVFNLLIMEVIVGLPFFIIFLFLIAVTKKNARKQ